MRKNFLTTLFCLFLLLVDAKWIRFKSLLNYRNIYLEKGRKFVTFVKVEVILSFKKYDGVT